MKKKSVICYLFSPVNSSQRLSCPARLAGFAIVACSALASQASASVLVTGTDLSFRSASAEFTVTGDTLSILLSNTSTFDVTTPDQLLSSVYFRFSGSSDLTKADGGVTLDGSQVFRNGTNVTSGSYGGGGNVSGEFAFRSGLTGSVLGTNPFYGISANGMDDFFGKPYRFSTADLDPPDTPNGMNYGITSLGDDVGTYNGGFIDEPIIKYAVLISLKGATGLDLSELEDVIFQYGTSKSDPSLVGSFIPVPEPGSSAGLVGLISGGLLLRSRRRTNP